MGKQQTWHPADRWRSLQKGLTEFISILNAQQLYSAVSTLENYLPMCQEEDTSKHVTASLQVQKLAPVSTLTR
jgi:hypothetical protein